VQSKLRALVILTFVSFLAHYSAMACGGCLIASSLCENYRYMVSQGDPKYAAVLVKQFSVSPDSTCPYGDFLVLDTVHGSVNNDSIRVWFNNETNQCTDPLPTNIGDTLFLLIEQDYFYSNAYPILCGVGINDYYTFSVCASATGTIKGDSLFASPGVGFLGHNTAELVNYFVPIDSSCIASCLTKINAHKNPAYGIVNFTQEYLFCYGETQVLRVVGSSQQILWFNGDTTSMTTFTADSGQVYWVQLTDSFNCVLFDTFQPYVSAQAFVSSPNDTAICLGDCLILTYEVVDYVNPSALLDFSFNSGSPSLASQGLLSVNFCPTQSGWIVSRLEPSFPSLCYVYDSVYVEVNNNPNSMLNVSDSTICPMDTIQISASGNYNFLWSTGDTSSSIRVAPTMDTIFYVEISDSNGCVVFDSVVVEVELSNTTFSSLNTDTICSGGNVYLAADSAGGYSYLWSTGDTTSFMALASGVIFSDTTFQLSVTSIIGCVKFYNLNVFVLPLPIVTLNNFEICEDSFVQNILLPNGLGLPAGGIFSGGPTGITFNGNIIQVASSVTAGNYSFYYNFTDAFGCTNIDSANLTIAPSLATPVLSNNGDTIFINATTCDSILWAVGSQTFSTTQNYIVIDTVVDIKALCYDGYCRSPLSNVFSHMPVGLEDAFNGTLKIYPTVFNKHLTVEPEEALEWQLINVDGKEILSGFAENKTEIATSQIASGMYFFVVQTDENIQSIKLIKP